MGRTRRAPARTSRAYTTPKGRATGHRCRLCPRKRPFVTAAALAAHRLRRHASVEQMRRAAARIGR